MTKINSQLSNRYSPKDFDPEYELSHEQVNLLFEAARLAPSSFNEQPWKFFYATRQNKDGFAKLYDTIVDGNKPWSGDASILIIGASNTKFTRNGKNNRHALYDLGQAVMSLMVQVVEMNLHGHQMGGFSTEKANKVLNLSENEESVVMIAIGKSLGSKRVAPIRKKLNNIAISI